MLSRYWDCTGECLKKLEDDAHEPQRDDGLRSAGLNFADWQKAGWDKGSRVEKMPSPSEIMNMARRLLRVPHPPAASH